MQIFQYWHSTDVPSYLSPLLDSFRKTNPSASYRLFDEAAADQFIATHYSAREVKAFRTCAVPAMQSDYFRYCAVLASGGAYSDADMLCVANLESLLAYEFKEGALFLRPDNVIMNAFFLFRSPGSLFLR